MDSYKFLLFISISLFGGHLGYGNAFLAEYANYTKCKSPVQSHHVDDCNHLAQAADELFEKMDEVFNNQHPMIWPPTRNPWILKELCTVWERFRGYSRFTAHDLSPKHEHLMAEGFREMMDYILCDRDGQKGYHFADACLEERDVRDSLQECFDAYDEYLLEVPYDSLDDNDKLIHEHCDVFKTYQQCRSDVFSTNCSGEVEKWANEAFVRYYKKYMESVYCDIDGGLTTKEIIFIALGCVAGMLFLFCACFCARRICCLGDGKKQPMAMQMLSKKKSNVKKGTEDKPEKNGVVNKGIDKKDVEVGKTVENEGYYNTKETDNNTRNEMADERRNAETIYSDIHDPAERRKYDDRYRKEMDRRDDRYRDERMDRRDDRYHMDYRDPRRDYGHGSPRQPHSKKQRSYDDMFESHVRGMGLDLPNHMGHRPSPYGQRY